MRVNKVGLAAMSRSVFGSDSKNISYQLRLTVLGCGTLASTTRNPVAYFLENAKELMLIDCNSRALTTFHQFGFDLTRLTHIFIGHDHTDHSHGVVEWLEAIGTQCAMRGGLVPQLKQILGPRGIAAEMQKDIDRHLPGNVNYLRNKFPGLKCYQFEETMLNFPSESADISVFPTTHDHALPSVGFRISTRGFTITYPCDFGALQNTTSIEGMLENANLIILDAGGRQPGEATHLHISEAIELARRFKPDLLLASHIPDVSIPSPTRPSGAPERVMRAQEIIDESGVQNVVIAETGMYIDF